MNDRVTLLNNAKDVVLDDNDDDDNDDDDVVEWRERLRESDSDM